MTDKQTGGGTDTDACMVKVMNIAVVDRFRYIQPVWIACHWLAMSNCCYNPIVYCWMSDKFRYGFRYAFRWCPCVRSPDIPPAVSNDRVLGQSTMYGGMRLSDLVTRGSGGRRARGGSATVASLCAAKRSMRVETDVVADPTPFSVRWSATGGETLQPELTTCRDNRLRGTRKELESVVERC